MSRRVKGTTRVDPPSPPKPEGFAEWGRRMVDDVAKEMPDEELATLRAQVKTFDESAGAAVSGILDRTAATVVRDRKKLREIVRLFDGDPETAIDLETSGLDPRVGEVVGIGLSVAATNVYIPVGHRFADTQKLRPDQLPLDLVIRELRPGRLPLIAHNAKFELRWLRRHAGVTCKFAWDVMLAARLLASHLPADLKSLAVRELDVPDWSLTKDEIEAVQFVSVDRVARYCCKDTRYTLDLFRRQQKCLS